MFRPCRVSDWVQSQGLRHTTNSTRFKASGVSEQTPNQTGQPAAEANRPTTQSPPGTTYWEGNVGRQNIALTPKQRIQAEFAAVAPAAPSSRPAGSFQLPLECRHVLPIKLHSSPPVVQLDTVLTVGKPLCLVSTWIEEIWCFKPPADCDCSGSTDTHRSCG